MINDNLHFGFYEIKVIQNGVIVEEKTVKNRVMDTVLTQLISSFKGNSPDLEIEYLALGTDDTPVTDSDTQLGAEFFRTPYVTRLDGLTGEVKHVFVATESEAVGSIKEIGIFGGSTASATANTGTLISRILWTRVKTASEEIQFTRTDRIVRG